MVATLIARQFLFLGGRAYNPTILLITPPALKQNWEDTLTKFEIRGKVKIFTNGSSSYSCPVFALALLLSSFRISLYSFLMRVKKLPSGKSSVELLPS
jgi:hypothetical protein